LRVRSFQIVLLEATKLLGSSRSRVTCSSSFPSIPPTVNQISFHRLTEQNPAVRETRNVVCHPWHRACRSI